MHDRTTEVEQTVARENRASPRYLIRLFRYVFSSAGTMCAVFLSLSILLSLLRPALAFLWGAYIDRANAYLPGGEILPMIGILIAYYIISLLSELLQSYTEGMEQIQRLDIVQQNRFQERVETRMLQKLSRLHPEYFEVPKIGDMIKRTFNFTSDSWNGMNRAVVVKGYFIIAKAVSVASIAASLYLFEPWLCLLVLLAPIPTLYTTYVADKIRFKFKRDHTKVEREAGYYHSLLLYGAHKEIKTLGLHDFFYDKWKTRIDEYTRQEKQAQVSSALLGLAGRFVSSGTNVTANIIAILLLTAGRLSIGALGAVMSLISSLIGDTGSLFSSAASFFGKKNEAAQFFELMDLPDRVEGSKEPEDSAIALHNVRYRYPMTDRTVLEVEDFSIRPGERVAFVGENGAGKTTMVKLLCGMLVPSEGTVMLGGRPVEELGGNCYHVMSAVFQDPVQYNTFTVGDSAFLGRPNAPRDGERVGEALAFAGLSDIDRDALLGRSIGGTELSGGQWQKLAIARARYRGGDLIFLDEPTSNLDPLAEADIFRKYSRLAGGSTVVMVTHRISVASLADRVVVFAGGRIVEDGTHQELLHNGGEYTRLYETQAKWYDR